MAKPEIDESLLMPNESKLAKAEATRYIDQQKTANFYTKVADYMFWGATSLILPIAGVFLGVVTAPVTTAALVVGTAISATTFVGSLFFARKATDISERSNVLYSDIDSQNQARRMVQAFARAQSQSTDASQSTETLFTSGTSEKTWTDRTQTKPAPTNDRWQDKIAAKADHEDALALEQFSR